METLADRIARDGPIKELDAVGWAIRLAKRLEALHSLGVAHGSVSPACIVTAGVERTAKAHLADVQHTSSIPSFHSPERIMGGDISTADDTWAVAVTLYTALTGTNPFGAPRDVELRHRIVAAAPTPLAVFDVGDDDLQHILDRAFARELNRRSTSITALRQALEEWHPDPGVGELPPLDDEDGDDDGEDDNVRTVMRASPLFFAKPAAAPKVEAHHDDDEDDDDARTMMREPGMMMGGPPSPAAPAVGPGSPFGNPSAGFRPLGAGRNLAPARPAAGRAADPAPAPAPSSGRMPPPRMPPPVAAMPTPPAHDDDDDDDDVRTRMRSSAIDDEDSSDLRTKMREPGAWSPMLGAARPAAPTPAAGAPPALIDHPLGPAPGWGPQDDAAPARTVAFPGGFDEGAPPAPPPEEPERAGPGLNLFAAPKGPQLGPIGGGRAPMESGSYGRPQLDGFSPPAAPPSAAQAPAPAAPMMGMQQGPASAPMAPAFAQPQKSSSRAMIIVAVLALLVAAALTFVVLRYRGLLFPG